MSFRLAPGVVLLAATAVAVLGPTDVHAAEAPTAFKPIVDAALAYFPRLEADVVEVDGARVTLSPGRAAGLAEGIELEAYREGRELTHPVSGKPLGKIEQPLGRLVVAQALERYAVARVVSGGPPRPGDRARVGGGKVALAVVVLATGVSPRLAETVEHELREALGATGRFQVRSGDAMALALAERKILPADFLAGRAGADIRSSSGAPYVLAVHVALVGRTPLAEARLWSRDAARPLAESSARVPATLRRLAAAPLAPPASASGVPPQRSWVARLFMGDADGAGYSTVSASLPVRTLLALPYGVVAMDAAVAPRDGVARIALTDGEDVHVYALRGTVPALEWSDTARLTGTIFSVQLADLDGDGALEVVVNRHAPKFGMLSYVLGWRGGRVERMADKVPVLLFAVADGPDGVRRSLWAAPPHADRFFPMSPPSRWAWRDGSFERLGGVPSHHDFRTLAGTLSNIAGGDRRALAFVDRHGRLVLADGPRELWRSSVRVGGGLAQAAVEVFESRTLLEKVFPVDPHPAAIDLDGDGIDEVVVPVNQDEAGHLAVLSGGPGGYRLQVVASGLQGIVTGVGAVSVGDTPALVAAVVRPRRVAWFLVGGETDLVLSVPE